MVLSLRLPFTYGTTLILTQSCLNQKARVQLKTMVSDVERLKQRQLIDLYVGPKAIEVLELAHQKLNRLLDEQMHMALIHPQVDNADIAAQVHRFAKLYPMVKRHTDGVNKLCAFVQRQIEERALTAADDQGASQQAPCRAAS